MVRQEFYIRIITVFMVFISSFSTALNAQQLQNSRPNIILVMTDDQGMGDLSCMGNQILKTPNIDEFYKEATRFTDFQASPTCAPTRSAIMSGRVPFKNGVTHTIFQRERMALDVYTMPQALQSAGYATGLFGKWHLGDEEIYLPGNRGFDEVLMHGAGGIGQVSLGDFPPNGENPYFDNVLLHNETIVQTKGFCTDLFFNAALAWIKVQNKNENPYFAYISLNAPHGPYYAPDKYKKQFLDDGYDAKTAGRYGMIENIDDNFGRLLSKLEEWKALDNTLIVFMTDNGMSMPPIIKNGEKIIPYNAGMKGRKNSPYEGVTHVPFFMQWEGVLDQGVDIDALVAHIDLYRTFTELAGATLPEEMHDVEGRSLLPLFIDAQAEWGERELFMHCGRWKTGKCEESKFNKCAVRTSRWRFSNDKELYDITVDPGEKNNVIASYPEVVTELQNSYNKWWQSVKPLMVNEGLPKVSGKDQSFSVRYYKQLEEEGIPEWSPASID